MMGRALREGIRRSSPWVMACALFAALAVPAAAQEPQTPALRGVVVDLTTGTPLAGARLHAASLRRGTLADDDGAFEFPDVPMGVYLLSVEQYGYVSTEVSIEATRDAREPVRIGLEPKPVMLDGVSVVADRIELMQRRLTSRRRAFAQSSRAFEQERLMRSAAFDMAEFLYLEASLYPAPCRRGRLGSACVLRRGQPIEPRVYIDEAPVAGGLEQLATYQPHDLYLVEVYSLGLEIRAYTHMFMERMARRPMVLIPIGVGQYR